jgi:NADH-quinone oxidoreductase subunit G
VTTQKLVKIIIDGVEYEVPAGANLVDMAKFHADNDIPVFCYHPKLDPVGMCRMCVVELGDIERDRETKQIVTEADGSPKVRWMPKLQTACTQTVRDGMVVRTNTQKVDEARESVIEFLLTSHPLDCPICDKGGECPLQNLTMAHGKGTSRMDFSDKNKMDKHVPLGELIYLDQERCIQCARCIRFQDELVGDDVLAFHERGRQLRIITKSDPGFDTYFSGNTTDICPVGALTTADFRFGARPWELTEVPSIDPHDAAGTNISLSTRLDRDFGGKAIIKRVMPRQNEYVNEIWISDKTRFVHHFTRGANRLTKVMVRSGSKLAASAWEDVVPQVANALRAGHGHVAALAGGAVSNEDLWELKQLLAGLDSERLGAWPPTHDGALLAEVGVGQGTNLGTLGKGSAVLVIASDLEEQVPLWRLRLKAAQDRGAMLVVAHERHTRLADFAAQTERRFKPVYGADLRYAPGQAAEFMHNLRQHAPEVAQQLAEAENLVIVAGADDLNLEGHQALMRAAANFLIETGHIGKPNNGLLAPLPGPNGFGLQAMGFTPSNTQAIMANPPKVLIVAQCQPLDDDPTAHEWLSQVETVIYLGLFADRTAQAASFVLPIQSFAERDGTFTNGERRVQRFYTAQGPLGDALPLWKAVNLLHVQLAQAKAKLSAVAVMLDISKGHPMFAGMTYKELGKVERQFPDVGGSDQYYGGTAYQNKGGLGLQIPTSADQGQTPTVGEVILPAAPSLQAGELLIVPADSLYNRSAIMQASELLAERIPAPHVLLSAQDAAALGLQEGQSAQVSFPGGSVTALVVVDPSLGQGVAVLPRHLSATPTPMLPVVGTLTKAAELLAV